MSALLWPGFLIGIVMCWVIEPMHPFICEPCQYLTEIGDVRLTKYIAVAYCSPDREGVALATPDAGHVRIKDKAINNSTKQSVLAGANDRPALDDLIRWEREAEPRGRRYWQDFGPKIHRDVVRGGISCVDNSRLCLETKSFARFLINCCTYDNRQICAQLHLRVSALLFQNRLGISCAMSDAGSDPFHSGSSPSGFGDGITHLFGLSLASASSNDPQPYRRYGQNSSNTSETEGRKGDGFVRNLLPEGFWLVALAVFIIAGGTTGLIMYFVARWCGWLR